MDWQNERYVRLYIRDTGDMLAIGWHGRAMFCELLRKVDRAGVIDESDPEILSELLRVPLDVLAPALDKLLKRKVVEIVAGKLIIPNFIEAQESTSSSKQRQAESRARRRDAARLGKLENVTERDADVTKRDADVTKRYENVTLGHTVSHGVTPNRTVPSLTVPKVNTLSKNDGAENGEIETQIKIETTGQTPVLSATENKPKKTKARAQPSELATRAAAYLQKRVVARAPNCTASRMSSSALANWARDLDKLSKLSPGHDWATIGRSIDWLHDSDNGFVVQSAKSLVKKWDNIQVARTKTTSGNVKSEDPYERNARLKAGNQ